jgi:hypothetical protein
LAGGVVSHQRGWPRLIGGEVTYLVLWIRAVIDKTSDGIVR